MCSNPPPSPNNLAWNGCWGNRDVGTEGHLSSEGRDNMLPEQSASDYSHRCSLCVVCPHNKHVSAAPASRWTSVLISSHVEGMLTTSLPHFAGHASLAPFVSSRGVEEGCTRSCSEVSALLRIRGVFVFTHGAETYSYWTGLSCKYVQLPLYNHKIPSSACYTVSGRTGSCVCVLRSPTTGESLAGSQRRFLGVIFGSREE